MGADPFLACMRGFGTGTKLTREHKVKDHKVAGALGIVR